MTEKMPTDLEDVSVPLVPPSDSANTYYLARRIPPSWQYSDQADWYIPQQTVAYSRKVLRQSTAVETLVGYSSSNHAMFKINELEPIRDLKLLVKDYNVGMRRSFCKSPC
jgi:hypothetical protein